MQKQMLNLNWEGKDQKLPVGYRLHQLELLNWGTFDKQIWQINPHGRMALLTGANGSGKSTLVDALVTLLVPLRKRNYNQAAGGDSKRERTEQSYVLGAYGKIQDAETQQAKTQYMRSRDAGYTVLLAHFRNESYGKDVTLAQFFWFQDSLRKFYLVAESKLTIIDHFSDIGNVKELKKRLRKDSSISVFDEFSQYSRQFRKLFGLRSDKALDLFNQTVTIKEIGKLNDFVRNHMLEQSDIYQKTVPNLIENYQNLTRSYNALQTAKEQIALLIPMMEDAEKFTNAYESLQFLEETKRLMPTYLAFEEYRLVLKAMQKAETELAKITAELTKVKEGRKELEDREKRVNLAIQTDKIGQHLSELDRLLAEIKGKIGERKDHRSQYERLAVTLNLSVPDDLTQFLQNYKLLDEQIRQRLVQKRDEIENSRKLLQIESNEIQQEMGQLEEELASLKRRKSQIPRKNLELRQQLLDALHIPEGDIPFIGELVRVDPEQRAWEGGIERLLHNFGLRLLVSDHYYDKVVAYVKKTHLNGRLVFHSVSLGKVNNFFREDLADDSLIRKLELRKGIFADWIDEQLRRQYNYICTDDLGRFQRENRAISSSGLIKGSHSLYEKDDRRRIDDRRYFILGWENKEKIRLLEEELKKLQQDLGSKSKQIDQLNVRLEDIRSGVTAMQGLLRYQQFEEIDFLSLEEEQQKYLAEKERLEKSSDQLKQLKVELVEIKDALIKKNDENDRCLQQVGKWEGDLKRYRRDEQRCKQERHDTKKEDLEQVVKFVRQKEISSPTRFDQFTSFKNQVEHQMSEEILTTERSKSQHKGRLEKKMLQFKNQYLTDTEEMDASVESIPAFESLYQRIKEEDLPQYEERFKKLLNEKMVENIVFLRNEIEQQEESIRENIEHLNKSLKTIDYTPETFIQLQLSRNRDPEIQDFDAVLRQAIPDVGAYERDYEQSFQKIKRLIDRFEQEDRWTRKVTDIRNWLDFAVSERYREDDVEREYYSDSSGKSGGQKAKFAYTILASAIAYQFGLEEGKSRPDSFRFVVIDEAFSRSDERNAHFAMQLFKSLKLQLLVVTPMTGMHIVEPYISACHLVLNNQAGNDSQLVNMSKEAYQEMRDKLYDNA